MAVSCLLSCVHSKLDDEPSAYSEATPLQAYNHLPTPVRAAYVETRLEQIIGGNTTLVLIVPVTTRQNTKTHKNCPRQTLQVNLITNTEELKGIHKRRNQLFKLLFLYAPFDRLKIAPQRSNPCYAASSSADEAGAVLKVAILAHIIADLTAKYCKFSGSGGGGKGGGISSREDDPC